MKVTLHRLPDGLYAFGDGPFRPRMAIGGPFVDAEAAWIWLIDLGERQLTAVQKVQWGILYDAFTAWLKRRGPHWTATDRWATRAALLEGLTHRELFGLGRTTLPQLARIAAGDDWRPVLAQLEAAASEAAA